MRDPTSACERFFYRVSITSSTNRENSRLVILSLLSLKNMDILPYFILTHEAHLGGKCKKSVNYENIEL